MAMKRMQLGRGTNLTVHWDGSQLLSSTDGTFGEGKVLS